MPKGNKSNNGQPKGPSRGQSKGPSKGPAKGPPRTAFQLLQQQLKWVDLIFEVLDARAPLSSRHPKHSEIFGNKPRLIFLTKDDLADPKASRDWAKKLSSENEKAIVLCLKDRRRQPEVVNMALELSQEKLKQIEAKGLLPRPVRICVVGMPNTGKSSLINWLIGKKQVKVADRPGVTRGPQWIRVHPKLELLDTPGILPPTISSRNVGEKLGIFNLAPAGAYTPEELAERAIVELQKRYPGAIQQYLPHAEVEEEADNPIAPQPYTQDENSEGEQDGQNWIVERDLNISKQSKLNRLSGQDTSLNAEAEESISLQSPSTERINLQLIAERKRFLTTKGRPDTSRAAAVFLGDIRNGKLGRITFDSPSEK